MNDLNDIVASFNRGEARGYEALYKHYYRPIFHFAWKIVGNKEDAKDLSNHVFAKLFEKKTQLNTTANIKAFLFISTRNVCLDFMKSEQRRARLKEEFASRMEDDYRLQLEYSVKMDIMDALQKAIKSLPEIQQRVFHLLVIEDRKPAEVAQLLNTTIDNLYTLKKRVLHLLRLQLSDNGLKIISLCIVGLYIHG